MEGPINPLVRKHVPACLRTKAVPRGDSWEAEVEGWDFLYSFSVPWRLLVLGTKVTPANST